MAQWLTGKVVENYRWNDTLFSLRVVTEHFPFTAGQFVRLGLQGEEQRIQRAYSLVNGPHESVLDFLVTRVEDGLLSPSLDKLQPGDEVEVSQPPSGFFVLDEIPDGDTLWLLSTGTGIGPYLSILSTDAPWRRFNKIVLVHAVRHAEDLAYQAKIEAWQQQHPEQLVYQPVVSREQVPGILKGRIPQLIEMGELQQSVGQAFDDKSQVMLCGNPDMIRDCKALLDSMGLKKNLRRKPGQVTAEQYW